MIDLGCTHTCIGEKMVKKENIPTQKLVKSMTARNADGSVTGNKQITDFVEVEMEVNGHKEDLEAVVMPLDSPGLLLGYDWLTYHNLEIDWSNRIMKFKNCPETCKFPHNDIPFPRMRRLKADTENSPEEKEADPTNPEDLPSYIQPFTHLFNKKNFDKLPDRTEWDHEINLTSEAPKEISSKVYNMTPLEIEELDRFLDENLASKRIKPSKLPYAAPCFFVPKKDKLLCLCQDYRKLNEVSVKDNTPLPLISEVLDQLKDTKYFNKLDIIWGYNNVWIKEGDEWKAAFLTN
jgi:Fe-S-cluster containining protein